jgi:hypothetical protein
MVINRKAKYEISKLIVMTKELAHVQTAVNTYGRSYAKFIVLIREQVVFVRHGALSSSTTN